MASQKIPGFPDVSNKLQAPTKKSLFERQKAEAEAKRQREAAETAAVYQDFVKSFDEDEGGQDNFASVRRDEGRGGFGGGRHFGRGGIPTGPGSGFGARGGMGSGPGSLGPPPSMNQGRKRNFEGFAQGGMRKDRKERGLLAFEDYEDSTPSNMLRTSDDEDEKVAKDREEEKAVAKPTLRLASLPPGTSPAVIKALVPTNLVVENVRILPPSGPGQGQTTERKSMSAIVTLAKDTAANDIDTAVSSLQNKYLGFGYYLNLHRHLSSAAVSSTTASSTLSTTTAPQPFGAKPVALPSAARGMPHPHPHPHPRGFAPPTSYAPPAPQSLRSNAPLLHVSVQPPNDIKQLRLIHKTIETLLTHGPEFEALLMSRPTVQREEKWVFLFDARSVSGVYYRYRLWEILTGTQAQRGKGKYLPLFEGASAWKQPGEPLSFEYVTKLDEFVSDSEYVSDSDEDSDVEGRARPTEQGAANGEEWKTYLSPLQKAKLVHLLARLPTSTSKLRKGDVARVTAFAISHAGRGADEVVTAIIDNLFHPFCYSSANPTYIPPSSRHPHRRRKSTSSNPDPSSSVPPSEDHKDQKEQPQEEEDHSTTTILTLHLISSILSTSSTSGVRHAWRYRQLFETCLTQRKVFEYLGEWERRGKWGRLRAEKWKRMVLGVLALWEGWCAVSGVGMEGFRGRFEVGAKMVVVDDGRESGKEMEREREREREKEKGRNRWKAVEVEAARRKVDMLDSEPMEEEDEDEDLDGVPMDEDENIDGEPMEDDVDGEPMDEDEPPVTLLAPDPKESEGQSKAKVKLLPGNLAPEGQPRRRPRAVDMFADSDEE